MKLIATLPLEPVTAPRQVRSDKWNARDCVVRYREFQDRVQWFFPQSTEYPEQVLIVCCCPMPGSWSEKKRKRMDGQPKQTQPDWDNYGKAVQDAVFYGVQGGDSHIWDGRVIKVWSLEPRVEIWEQDCILEQLETLRKIYQQQEQNS